MRVYYISIISYVFFLFFLDQLFPAKIERIFLRVMGILGIVLVLAIVLCSVQFVAAYETVIFSYRILALLGFTLMMVRIFRTDTSYVPYDLILMYFALFIFTTKNVFFYLRFNDESQTTYVELAIAVAVMIQIVLKKYKTVHQEQLKLALAFHNARIKPHFLFNALNSIHDAIYEEPQTAQKLLMAFSQFLRNRFRFTDFSALVPLSEEIDILDAYLEIEHDRFRERILIERRIDQNAVSIRVPQLFLQPIVENAIHHGVLKQRRGGVVTIIIQDQGDSVLVEVRDTGVGMTPERLNEVFRGGNQDSIGIVNIHTRLLYLYGRGLEIESVPGEGTVVRYKIPTEGPKLL
jgi:sensor histidine kinase YesM